jgi:uncharacterized coiled-coil DUF342 family protein
MKELAKVLAETKKKADQKHAEYIAQSEERHEAIIGLRNNLARIDEIRAQIRDATPSKVEKAERLRSKYKEAANEKIRTGGKLSFEEFQALMGDSPSESDDE